MAKLLPYQRDRGRGAVFPAVKLAQKDPALAAAVAKAVSGQDPVNRDQSGNRRPVVDEATAFYHALQKRARRNADASTVVQLLPDLELSTQILVSCILSPKDMMAVDLIYNAPKNLFSSELVGRLLDTLRTSFSEEFKIESLVSDMLREVLSTKGAYPVAVIPENAIDAMINGHRQIAHESLRDFINTDGSPKSIGLLGSYKSEASKKPGLGLESFSKNTRSEQKPEELKLHYYAPNEADSVFASYTPEEYVTVTDNPAVLRFGELQKIVRGLAVSDAYQSAGLRTSMEALTPVSDFRVEQAIFQRRNAAAERTMVVPHQYELDRKTVGNPLVMKIPTESVIPVHVPGNPKIHVGYFIVLDEDGHPIECPEGDMQTQAVHAGGTGSIVSNLVQRVKTNLIDSDSFNPQEALHQKQAYRIYADLIERDLISRVKNGRSAASVAIARNEEVYRLMLSRTMAHRHTQLLYIPVEYMTYIAFYYTSDGIGQSLLDKQAMINALRSVLLFSDVMASVKNSIGRTKVSVSLEKDDPNPLKSIEHIQDEIVRSRQLNIPMNIGNPVDITDFVNRAGYDWDITGHPGLPDMKFDFTQNSTNYAKPDSDLTDRLRKASIQGMGLSPETVDNGFNTEFATTAMQNNILLSKRVIVLQDLFTPQLSDVLRKVARNTESLVNTLKSLLEQEVEAINLKDEDLRALGIDTKELKDEDRKRLIVSTALHMFLNQFSVELPRPNSVTVESQTKELSDYSDMLDKALDAYLTSDYFTKNTVGDLADSAQTVRSLYKSYFLRKWMAEKGIAPELAEITATSKDQADVDSDIVRSITDHLRRMTSVAVHSLVQLNKNAEAADKDLKKAGIDPTQGVADTNGGGFGGGSSFGGGGDLGGFSTGGDDFGMGDGGLDGLDNLGGDTPPEPEPEPEPDLSVNHLDEKPPTDDDTTGADDNAL